MTAAGQNGSFADAVSAYQAALAAEDTYDSATWSPAYEASNGVAGVPIPDDVEIEMERLQDVRRVAEDALFAAPCTEIRHVIVKLTETQKRWGYCGIPEELIGKILTDLAGLSAAAGEAPWCLAIQTPPPSTTVTADNYRNEGPCDD